MTINEDSPDGDAPATDETEDVATLVAQGKYEQAARRAAATGDHRQAADLYERIWEFGLAADSARLAGDLGRALRNAIEARDDRRVHVIASELSAEPDGVRATMEIFAGKRRFAEAGALAESLGELDAAIEYFKSAHRELDAARLLEATGRDREAGRLLERLLRIGPPGDDRARAELALGTILERRMNHEAAARHLQEAARHPVTRTLAHRRLAVALAAMGLRDAAREVVVAARAEDPDLPADIDEFIRAERDALYRERERGAESDRAERVIGGRYRLHEAIGAGGAGRVFRARDEVSARPCAVKVFHTAHSRGNQAYERFVREARLASSLRHPNLVEVYDFSADQGYLVMELMTGSLEERLADGPLGGRVVKRLALDILAGLELAHQRGVIHRDVKPANIFFDARGTAKLGDFGVAHLLDLGQTQTGGLIGTLAYMAPEQITGAPLTITADLYALGITLFQALTGRLPFLGPDFVAQHLGEAPPAPSQVAPGVAPGWDAVIARLLRKNPSERYPVIEEVRRQLVEIDLGEDSRPTVLMLPRAGARVATTSEASAGAAGTRAAASVAGANDGDTAAGASPEAEREHARYQFETPLGTTDISHISRAVDTVLERSVIIERYREGAMDQATEHRLYALARGGGPFLQRALSYDKAAGVAVFEAPSGAPMSEVFASAPLAHRSVVRLLERLACALAPLHATGNAHGAINPHTVLIDDELNPTLLVCGLGRARTAASPSDDVRDVLELSWRALGASPSEGAVTARLVDALVSGLPEESRRAIASLPDPHTGEELYALIDAVEIALLSARLEARA